MILVKLIFYTWILILVTPSCYAQDSSKNCFFLAPFLIGNSQIVSSIDSVFLYSDERNLYRAISDLKLSDNLFAICDLQSGEYIIKLKRKNFELPEYRIVVCAKCQNKINAMFFPTDKTDHPLIVNLIYVGPSYVGGYKNLRREFYSKLSDNEQIKLSSSSQFKVNAIITKNKEICNIEIDGKNINNKKKKIILKGMSNLTNWIPAKVNGENSDGKITINSSLLENW